MGNKLSKLAPIVVLVLLIGLKVWIASAVWNWQLATKFGFRLEFWDAFFVGYVLQLLNGSKLSSKGD